MPASARALHDPPPRHRVQPRSPERRRLAERRMRPRRLRRRAAGRVHRDRPRRAGRSSHAADHHRRALLRRRRRHATHHACALRRPRQQGLGTGAAQALLPLVQLRIAGRRNRRRPQHRAGRAAQLSARRRLSLPASGNRARRFWSRPRWRRRSSTRAGAGTPTARWRCCASRAARKFRRRFSAFAATIFWRRSFPTSPPATRTSKATSRFPITRSSTR